MQHFIVNVHLNTINETSNIGMVFELAFGCVKHTANESYCHTKYNANKNQYKTFVKLIPFEHSFTRKKKEKKSFVNERDVQSAKCD